MKRINPILAVPVALLALGVTSLLFSDDHDKKTDLTISEPVQIPGGTILAPGKYMFILNNSASNRNIIEIKSEDGKQLYAMLLAQRANRVERTGKTVLTFYEMPEGQPQALRQWFWPGDYDGQEFLYRHNEAQKIAKATNQTVPEATDQEYAAIGNAGNAATDAAPSASAAQPAPINTSPDQGSSTQSSAAQISSAQSDSTQQVAAVADSSQQQPIQSEPAQVTQPNPPAGELLAQNNPPANLTPPASQDAANGPNPNVATESPSSLPQTASHFPLIGAFGFLLLAGGAALRFALQGA
jgi:hypothetical protein